MSRSTKVANGLIRIELPSSLIADIAFKHASSRSEIKMPTPVSASMALGSRKAEWGHAATHALSATDPVVLDKLARDSRKQVRRAVAHNPNVSEAAASYLYEWALKADDVEALCAALQKANLDRVIGVGYPVGLRGYPYAELAQRIVTSADPKHLAWALEYTDRSFKTLLAAAIVKVPEPTISLSDYVALYDTKEKSEEIEQLLIAAGRATQHATTEFCELLVRYNPPVLRYEIFPRTIEEAGIDVLLESENRDFHLLVSRAVELPRQIDRLIELTEGSDNADRIWTSLIDMRIAQLSTEQLNKITLALVSSPNPRISGSVALRFFKLGSQQASKLPQINSALVMLMHVALRSGQSSSWLLGLHAHQPQPGDVEMFFHVMEKAGTGMRALLLRVLGPSGVAAILEKPWADEFIDGLGVAMFEFMEMASQLPEYFVRRVTARIGTEPAAWDIMFSMLETFDGSLATLLDTTESLMRSSGIAVVPAAHA